MAEVKSGDTVRIHYKGTLNDGSLFDSSEGRQPLEFTVGAGQIIPGLDREIAGMSVGDNRDVKVAADEAYGPHDPQKVQVVPLSAMPQEVEVAPGMQLQARTPQRRNGTVDRNKGRSGRSHGRCQPSAGRSGPQFRC